MDSSINQPWMEMYAEQETARGGVLEAEGTVDVKFKPKELLAAMHAHDKDLRRLDALLLAAANASSAAAAAAAGTTAAVSSTSTSSASVAEALRAEIKSREKKLLPMYHQVTRSSQRGAARECGVFVCVRMWRSRFRRT